MTYDCRGCGACCFSTSSTYIRVGLREVDRGRPPPGLVHWDGGLAYLRMADGRCAALVPDAYGLSCSIYRDRPDACRALEPGSGACLEERAAKRRLALRMLEEQSDDPKGG